VHEELRNQLCPNNKEKAEETEKSTALKSMRKTQCPQDGRAR